MTPRVGGSLVTADLLGAAIGSIGLNGAVVRDPIMCQRGAIIETACMIGALARRSAQLFPVNVLASRVPSVWRH